MDQIRIIAEWPKSPFTGKPMRLHEEPHDITYKGESYTINHLSFVCDHSGEGFTTLELDEMNMRRLHAQVQDRAAAGRSTVKGQE